MAALVRARHLEAPEKMRPFEFSPLRIFPALVIIMILKVGKFRRHFLYSNLIKVFSEL